MSELIESVKEILPISGLGIALALGTYAFAKYSNETLNEDIRKKVSDWFLGNAPKLEWQSHVLAFFNAIYGDKYFSDKCLNRVIIVWVVTTVLFYTSLEVIADAYHPLALFLIQLGTPVRQISDDLQLSIVVDNIKKDHVYAATIGVLMFSFIVSFEYLTVMKTRFLLGIIRRYSQSMSETFLILIIDILTCSVTLTIIGFKLHASEYLLALMLCVVPSTIHSLWLVIYFLATILARAATWLSTRLPLLGKILSKKRIEEAPLTLVGEFGAAIVLVAFLCIGLLSPSGHNQQGSSSPTKIEAPAAGHADER